MSRKKVYTGWKVVAASSALWALQSMLWMQGFGNLAVELRRQFGWSKTLFSVAFVGTRTGSSLLGPLQGAALGRWGTKRIMRVGASFVLLGFVGLSRIQTRTEFLLALSVAAFGMALAGFLTITSAVVQWFERKRAQALSMQTMGLAIGGFAGPLLVVGFGWFGWRPTMVGAGVVLTLAIYFASTVIGADRSASDEPVDGIPADMLQNSHRPEGVNDVHFTAQAAMRTRAFWMISMGHGSALIVVSAGIAHLALYLTEDRGFDAREAALIAGAIPVFQFLGTGLGGFLGDRVNKRIIVGVAMCFHAAGLLLMTWVESFVTIGAFVVLHGLAWGARGPLMQAIRADYFGSTYFAQIMGWSSIIVTLGVLVGPLLAGILADSSGNYRLGFTIIALLALAGNVFWALATPPPAPEPTTSEATYT
ncbi:MAG: MFS transporter, partial [Acidimicrobiales bacterium]